MFNFYLTLQTKYFGTETQDVFVLDDENNITSTIFSESSARTFIPAPFTLFLKPFSAHLKRISCRCVKIPVLAPHFTLARGKQELLISSNVLVDA